jgi:protein-L-isoaspartate(D-aspartate) O-methyltransferase
MSNKFNHDREELVKKLKGRGIEEESVLKAIGNVERHLFVPTAMVQHAYKDVALPIGADQTISQPYTVAFMTQLLKVKPGSKILEIGTGSGYQAAILNEMGAKVYSIERQFELYQKTQKLFDELGIRVHLKYGDGTIGWEEFSPYEGIIVTAGSPSIPPSLKKQLAVGGKLVIPVGNKTSQRLHVITRLNEKDYDDKSIPEFAFVPLIGREGWKEK